jgi:c-di-AMP phosphodiesterase-like protein
MKTVSYNYNLKKINKIMEPTTKSSATNYGLYLGAILSLITVLIYAVNLDLFTEWWLGIVLFLVVVACGVVSAVKSRTILNGFISFKQAFTSYFITIAIGTLIATVVGIAIFTFIDPEAATYLNEQILLVTKQTMQRFGMPQEAMQAALEEAATKDNFSLGMQSQAFAFRLAFYAVIGLIVALIVKKTDEKEA